MTTGSKTEDFRKTFQPFTRSSSGSETPFGSVSWVGRYLTKSWTGTDYPATRPVYETIVHWSPFLRKKLTYKRRIAATSRPFIEDHPYSATILDERRSMSSAAVYDYRNFYEPGLVQRWVYSKTVYNVIAPSYTHTVVSASEWNAADDLALLGKLRESIAGSDFNMGVFLGEGQEALKMIFNSATRIRKAITQVKRGNLKRAADALLIPHPKRINPKGKTVSAVWLELQYGWLPLLKDAEGAAQFLAKLLQFPMCQTYAVRRKKKQVVTLPTSGWTGIYGSCYTRKQILARVKEVNVYQLAGLTDPASVAWELVPFSFVADWFIPIGNYLAARGLANALTGTFVTTTKRHREYGVGAPLAAQFPGQQYTIVSGDGGWQKQVTFSRTVSSSLAVPLPSIKPLGDVLSWKRAANAVALMVQLGPKLRPDG